MIRSILAFGHHDQHAQRHWSMTNRLRGEGSTLIECHTTKQGLLSKYVDLTCQFWKQRKRIDTVLVTFPGQYLMPLAWLLTRFPRKYLLFDAFVSVWDSLVTDRKKYARWHPMAWFLYCVDFLSCHLADEVLIDTEAHRQFFMHTFKINPKKIRVEYLGTRTDLFYPDAKFAIRNSQFEVLFFGSYIPLQGIEHILDAAEILQSQHSNIHFTMIGSGQTYPAMRKLAEEKQLHNVTFKPRVPMEELPDSIRNADLCLGIFGTSGKAQRVIPHKVYDAVACGVAVLTADTPAIREKFTNGKEVHFCEAGNAKALAEKILEIVEHN